MKRVPFFRMSSLSLGESNFLTVQYYCNSGLLAQNTVNELVCAICKNLQRLHEVADRRAMNTYIIKAELRHSRELSWWILEQE